MGATGWNMDFVKGCSKLDYQRVLYTEDEMVVK
jgi:hypothetical protein